MAPRQAAIYCRVSTAEQVEGTSLAEQERLCREYVVRQGWALAAEPFVDEGVSGAKADRPEWRRMLAMAQTGAVDVVVVAKLDRFSRSVAHALSEIQRMQEHGVALVSLAEDMDFTGLTGELMRTILLAFAEFERGRIAERGVSGQRAKARSNRWPGGEAPYGYQREGQGRDVRLVPHPIEREVITVAVGEILAGATTGEVAALLNERGYRGRQGGLWTHQRVRRTLTNESLIGRIVWGKYTRKSGHNTVMVGGRPKHGDPIEMTLDDPPLTEAEWTALSAALSRRAYGTKRESKPYPLSGATSGCGSRLGGVWRADRDLRQYRCREAVWRASVPPRCNCSRIDADWLDGQVWSAVVQTLSDPATLHAVAARHLQLQEGEQVTEELVAKAEREVVRLADRRAKKIREWAKADMDPALIVELAAEHDADIAVAQSRVERLRQRLAYEQVGANHLLSLQALAADAAERLPSMTLTEQVAVLHLLRVEVRLLDGSSRPSISVRGVIPDEGLGGSTGLPTIGNLGDSTAKESRSSTFSLP